MNQLGTVAMAIGVGYLLGRRRKLSSALVLGTAAAAGQLGKGPLTHMLCGETAGKTAGEASGLSRLGGAGKVAARTALGKPMEMLTERLNEGAKALRQTGKPQETAGAQQQPSQQPQGGQQQETAGAQQQPSQQQQGGQQQETAASTTAG
jgi:hypothetical protein